MNAQGFMDESIYGLDHKFTSQCPTLRYQDYLPRSENYAEFQKGQEYCTAHFKQASVTSPHTFVLDDIMRKA